MLPRLRARSASVTVGICTPAYIIHECMPPQIVSASRVAASLALRFVCLPPGGLEQVMIDEIHFLAEGTRGSTLEAVVSRMKTVRSHFQSKDHRLRFLGASATISNVGDIARWLGTAEKSADCLEFGEEYRPVRLNTHVETLRGCGKINPWQAYGSPAPHCGLCNMGEEEQEEQEEQEQEECGGEAIAGFVCLATTLAQPRTLPNQPPLAFYHPARHQVKRDAVRRDVQVQS